LQAVLRYVHLVLMLLFACSSEAQAGSEPVEWLQSRRYGELERKFQAIQDSFKQGAIDDETLLASFRPFYDVQTPDLTARFDEWIAQFPESYVAHLARGIHYKYRAIEAQDGRFPRELGDDRFDALRRAEKLAAADFERSFALDDRPLLSYMHAMDVSNQTSWRWPERRLFAKANEVAPKNFIARRKYLLGMRSRWGGGTVAQMQEFVQECRALGYSERQMRALDNVVKEEQAWLALHRQQDYASAERLYREIFDEEPDNKDVAASLAWLLMKRGDCVGAISLATRVLQEQPRNARTTGDRGLCYFRTGQEQLGIADYQRAAELGDPWAQKHLARYYWQGNLVPKDRDRALQLLRASAVQGDQDAIAEYERVTGQKLPERRDRRSWGAAIKLGLAALLVVALTRWLVFRFHREPAPGQLRHAAPLLSNGVQGFVFFTTIAVISNIYGNHTATLWTSLLFVSCAALCLWSISRYVFGKLEYTAEGISGLPWRDVTHVRYSWGRLVLESEGRRPVRISLRMLGLAGFARAALDHVPSSAIDADMRGLLTAMADHA
jgi:TPR repeat protein